jgi:polyphosphate kinase
MARTSNKQKFFNGRDFSWMQFNRRVLEEAEDASNPLLERVKFLAITANNLDEYVEVRQAGLMQRIEDGYREPGYDGLRPDESLAVLTAEIHEFINAQYRCWNHQLLPEMRKHGIRLLEWNELDDEARAYADNYFQREVDPLLTPISIDPAHPFPRVLNKALCLALLLRAKRRSSGPQVLGVVTVPRALPRFVRLPAADDSFDYVLLQDLIEQHLAGMYRGYEVLARAAFRVTRNSNLYFEEEEARSLLETIRVELHNRRKGDAVRLEIESSADPEIVERLRVNFEPRPQIPSFHPQTAAPEPQVRRYLRRDSPARCPAASPLRLLRHGGRFHAAGRERSGCFVDEADPLPHQPGLAILPGADRSRCHQGGHAGGGADGPVR